MTETARHDLLETIATEVGITDPHDLLALVEALREEAALRIVDAAARDQEASAPARRRRTRDAIERDAIATVEALGVLRATWQQPARPGPEVRRTKEQARQRATHRPPLSAAAYTHKRDALYARLETLAVDLALTPRAADAAVVILTHDQIRLLVDAVDSHLYERAPEGAPRNSGFVLDPRLDRDEDEPLTDDEQEIATFLDAHDAIDRILTAHLPKES